MDNPTANNRRTNGQRKKCHGNRRRRLFKKRCRTRGMTVDEIEAAIRQYEFKKSSTSTNGDTNPEGRAVNMEITMNSRLSTKRKQIAVSTISLPTTSKRHKKKLKKKKVRTNPESSKKPKYRLSKYLKKPSSILFQGLRLQLKTDLKKKCHQQFIYKRLKLFDQTFRLDIHRNQWQSYLEIGSIEQHWPIRVQKLAKTHEHELCLEFVLNHIADYNQQYEQCLTKLRVHSSLLPSHFLSINLIDQSLHEFVQLQQKHFLCKMNIQLQRYKSMIDERKLYQTLLVYNLTEAQRQNIDRLLQLRKAQLKIFENLSKLETRLSIEFLPKHVDQCERMIDFHHTVPLYKDSNSLAWQTKRYKIIQDVKRKWLHNFMEKYETKYKEYEREYKETLEKFQHEAMQQNSMDGTNLFDCFLTYVKHHVERLQEEISYNDIPQYRKKLLHLLRRLKKERKHLVNVSPKVIVDIVQKLFTTRELKHLSKGPNYIRPNQSTVCPLKTRVKKVEKELKDIMGKITKYYAENRDMSKRIPRTAAIFKHYQERLHACLTQHYSAPLPIIDQLRARREVKLVKSIRQKLKKFKLILRRTDKSGVLHIGRASDYKRKAKQYRIDTGAYEELKSNPLEETFLKVDQELNGLVSKKQIKVWQRGKLVPVRQNTELPYMYFLPKSHKKDTPLRPIVNTKKAPTTKISKSLDRAIRPMFDKYCRHTTFVDGVYVLDRLENYVQNDYLKSSTLFVTFDITNLYTMLPQEDSLKILGEFLREHHCKAVNGMDIDTIVALARLVLEQNVFVYEKKFYRQIIGGAMGSPFTLTLANIFMWKWEKETILSKLPSHEVYGRYIDDVFFTSNESETTIRKWLDAANKFHPNIKLTYQISKSVPFLDILISNQNGILSSSVYHKPAAEPTVLCFQSDHPRHVFRNVVQTYLMRAIRYSSTFEIFNDERRTIRLTLLLSGYPSTYINKQFNEFFKKYIPSYSSLLSLLHTEEEFFLLKTKLRIQPTIPQVIVNKRVAKVNDGITIPDPTTIALKGKEVVIENESDMKDRFFIHCTHEARFDTIKREIHDIHNSLFSQTPNADIRMIVGHRNNPNLELELSNKRPSSPLLRNGPSKKQKLNEHATTG